MTYSILARDPETGEMGVATQSQAFAVGHSVPWALPGFGVIATQSMGEPAYGELGLDAMRAGLTAAETLTALRSVDAHPERRQVAMIDARGGVAAYTGERCMAAAGHRIGEGCVALANMMASSQAWDAMVDAYVHARGPLASRLLAALRAAEACGGDFRGQRSAAIRVVRAERSGRPWRDHVVDLRVDDDSDAVTALAALVDQGDRYNRMVTALDRALDGDSDGAMQVVDSLPADTAQGEPDLYTWHTVVLALAGREEEATARLAQLADCAPAFLEVFGQFATAGLVERHELWRRLLAPYAANAD